MDQSNNDSKIVAVILGNGFDIANNFKTSYNDFVESEEFKALLQAENALSKHIYKVKTLFNWVDVEIEIGNYSFNLEESTEPNLQREVTKSFFKEYQELKSALYRYINSLTSHSSNPKMEKLIIQWLKFTDPDYNSKLFVVNFNYNVWDHIQFNNNAIPDNLLTGHPLHLHGVTNYSITEANNIVLGVDYNNKRGQNHNFIVKGFDPNAQDKEFFKNIRYADKIIIFGCSIGSTDTRYFKPIFNGSKNKEFEIYGYGSIELANIQSNIAKLCDFDSFKTNNNVKFLDSSIYS